MSLTIEEYSDREFLLLVADHRDAEGWVDSLEIAKALGFPNRKMVAQRFRWLWVYGATEREHAQDEQGNLRYFKDGRVRYTQRWRLTELGEAVALGILKNGQQKMLDNLGDSQLILAVRTLSERTRGDVGLPKLVQREWRYGHANGRA